MPKLAFEPPKVLVPVLLHTSTQANEKELAEETRRLNAYVGKELTVSISYCRS